MQFALHATEFARIIGYISLIYLCNTDNYYCLRFNGHKRSYNSIRFHSSDSRNARRTRKAATLASTKACLSTRSEFVAAAQVWGYPLIIVWMYGVGVCRSLNDTDGLGWWDFANADSQFWVAENPKLPGSIFVEIFRGRCC